MNDDQDQALSETELRLVALSRAVSLCNSGRIEAGQVLDHADRFLQFLLEPVQR